MARTEGNSIPADRGKLLLAQSSVCIASLQAASFEFPFCQVYLSACCITEHWQLLLLSMHCILCPLCGSLSRWQQSTATRLESTSVRSWRQAATDFIMQKVRRTNGEGHTPSHPLAPSTYATTLSLATRCLPPAHAA